MFKKISTRRKKLTLESEDSVTIESPHVKVETEQTEPTVAIVSKETSIFDSIAKYAVYVLFFLLPIFFLPTSLVDLGQIKLGLFILTITVAAISLAISVIYSGKISFISKKLLIPISLISLITLVSGFLSTSYKDVFVGNGSEIDSWYLISLFLLSVLVIPSVINTKEKIFKSFSLLWISFGIASVFQILRLFASAFYLKGLSNFLSLGGLFDLPALNTVGTWGDFGIMAGISAITLAITLDIVPLRKRIKRTFWSLFGIFTILSFVVSFIPIGFGTDTVTGGTKFIVPFIAIVGLFSLLFSVSRLVHRYQEKDNHPIKFPIANFILAIAGIIFIIAPVALSQQINNWINVPSESVLNIRPSLNDTVEVSKAVISSSVKNSLVGYGPHGFYIAWNQYRPISTNSFALWNTDFQFGLGYLPTMLVNNGILGLLSWIVFLMVLLIIGIRSVSRNKGADSLSIYTNTILFISALILWINVIINISGPAIMILTFLITGLLVSNLLNDQQIVKTRYSFAGNKLKGVLSVLVTMAFIVFIFCLAFTWLERTRSYAYSSEAMQMIYAKDANIFVVPSSMYLLQKAFSIYPSDIYTREINNLSLAQVNYDVSADPLNVNLANDQKANMSTTTIAYLNAAISSGQFGVNLNPNDFRNWLQLGSTMQTVAILTKDSNAANIALQSFVKAVNLAKNHPLPLYSLASLYVLGADRASAKIALEQALKLKPNFQEANLIYQKILSDESLNKSTVTNTTSTTASTTPASVISSKLAPAGSKIAPKVIKKTK